MSKYNPGVKLVYPFCRKANMIYLLSRNNARNNDDIYLLKTVKDMLETAVANKEVILSVDKIKCGDFYDNLEEVTWGQSATPRLQRWYVQRD